MKNNLGNKGTMAKNILYYMDINGKTRQDMCDALGVKYTTFTDWVKGNTYPRIDKIELMANYFGISKADLVEEHTQESDTPYYLNEDAREMSQFLFDNPDYKVLFDASRKVKKEDIEKVKRMIDLMNGDSDI